MVCLFRQLCRVKVAFALLYLHMDVAFLGALAADSARRAQLLPGGTGYLTDLGMTGPAHSILGVKPAQSIAKFRGDLAGRYEPAPGPCKLEGAIFTFDADAGKCRGVEQVALYD